MLMLIFRRDCRRSYHRFIVGKSRFVGVADIGIYFDGWWSAEKALNLFYFVH